jgi:serine protease Do
MRTLFQAFSHSLENKIQSFNWGFNMRVLIITAALLAAIQPAFAFDKAKLYEAYTSVVLIRGHNATGGLAYGSGVVVGKDKVLTNCHVFRSTKEPWISRGEDTYSINSVKADAWHDLCLVTTAPLPFKPALIGTSLGLKRGQEIVAFGHSNGVPAPLTSSGSVKALFDADLGKVIRSTAKFSMGASGSGLFDMDGRLVGINTFKTAGRAGGIHFALPIEWLDKLEKQTEISTFPISGKALWEEDEDKKPFYMQVAVPESRGDWPKLAQVAEKWTVAEPKNTEAWYALGLGYENSDKLELAEKAYKQATMLDSANFEALKRLGAIAKTRGDTAEMHRIQLTLVDIDADVAAEFSEMMGCGAGC